MSTLPSSSEWKDLIPLLKPHELAELDSLLSTWEPISLRQFSEQAWSQIEPDAPFIPSWHVDAVCEHLEAVTRGDIKTLLINIPPGTGKSLFVSVFWPCWTWINRPAFRWFYSSYDQTLSTRDSVRCRQLIMSKWYQDQWGDRFTMTIDQNQKTRFDNDRRGWRLATSVGGRGTGEHPDCVVVDDPHNVKQSESDLERQAAIDWFDGTISTRGKSRGVRRVIVMQRLHDKDLSGHVLKKGGWEHLCLPMRAEPGRRNTTSLGWTDPRTTEGELLCPQLLTEVMVGELERDMGPAKSAGQLQQRPVPAGGGMFKDSFFTEDKFVSAVPAAGQRVRYWDKAGSDSKKADWTVGLLMVKSGGLYWIEDLVRGQWEPTQRNETIRATAARDAGRYSNSVKIWIEQEPGNGGKESAQISVRELAGYPVQTEVPGKDKQVRADPFASQCGAGNVRLLAAPWNQVFIDELLAFPRGEHDDQVDAASGAFNKLALHREQPKASLPGSYKPGGR